MRICHCHSKMTYYINVKQFSKFLHGIKSIAQISRIMEEYNYTAQSQSTLHSSFVYAQFPISMGLYCRWWSSRYWPMKNRMNLTPFLYGFHTHDTSLKPSMVYDLWPLSRISLKKNELWRRMYGKNWYIDFLKSVEMLHVLKTKHRRGG